MIVTNELGTTVHNQVGEQVVHGNINYFGFDEHNNLRDQCLRDLLLEDARTTRDALKARKGSHAAGTCEWFLNSHEVKAWRDTDSTADNVFWLSGNPGTGKSTLMIHLVDALETALTARGDSCVIYFFCDTSAHYQNSAIAILRGLVYQLCRWSKYLLDQYLLLEYRIQGSKLFDSFTALWRVFRSMSMDNSCGHVYVVIDALDECDQDSQITFLQHFEQAYSQANPPTNQASFRFLITSRPYQSIGRTLSNFPHKDLGSYPQVERDIDAFINDSVSKLARVGYTTKLQQEASEIFKLKAEGTFLWIGLAYAEIKNLSVMDGLTQLRDLPAGLSEIYQNLLQRALDKGKRNTGSQNTIVKLLTVVAIALEPLTLADLAAATALYEEESTAERMLFLKETVAMCDFMIVIVDDYVRMLHKSVKDFIFRRACHIFPSLLEAHAHLASACVDRLLSDYRTQQTARTLQGDDSLVEYAVKHWVNHAHLAKQYFVIRLPEQAEFFTHCSESREAWLIYALALGEDLPAHCSLFHIAARWNIRALLDHTETEFFLKSSENSSGLWLDDFTRGFDTFRGNPLEIAAASNSSEVFTRLLALRAMERGKQVTLSYEYCGEPANDILVDEKLCYRFPISSRVVRMIVRNKKLGPELLELLWNRRRKELRLDKDIVADLIRCQTDDNPTLRLILQELLEYTMVDRSLLNAAAVNERSNRGLLGLILDLRGQQSDITQDVVFAAAQQFDVSIVEKVLQHYKEELLLTGDLVTAVAMNSTHRDDVMSFLLERLASPVEQYSREVIICIFGHFNVSIIQQFINFEQVELDERLLYASASNIRSGRGIFERLNQSLLADHITEPVMLAAASNPGSGRIIMKLLLKLRKARTVVTSKVLETVSNHGTDSHDLLPQLLDCLQAGTPINNELFRSLWRRNSNVNPDIAEQITVKILNEHASGIDWRSNEVMAAISKCGTPLKHVEMLLSRGELHGICHNWEAVSAKLSLEDITALTSLIRMRDSDWRALIHAAVASSRNDILEEFMFKCEDPARRALGVAAAASAAAQYHEIDVLRSVLQQGINFNKSDVLKTAVEYNNIDAFNLLIENGADTEACGGPKGLPLVCDRLMYVNRSRREQLEHLRTFIDNITDLDPQAHLCHTLLDRAIYHGNIKVVQFLIEYGFNQKCRFRLEWGHLELAIRRIQGAKLSKILTLLLHHLQQPDLQKILNRGMLVAAEKSRLHAAHLLLRRGAFLSSRPVWPFAKSRHIRYISKISARAQWCQIREDDERHCVSHAPELILFDLEACQILYDANFNFFMRNEDNRTSLMEAVVQDLPDHLTWLLKIGVDANAVDKYGYGALHYSVQRSLVTTKILFHAGADLCTVSGRGETILHCATASGKLDVVCWLINQLVQECELKASERGLGLLDKTDGLQRTALHLALYNNRRDIAELLKSKGARTDIPDQNGITAETWTTEISRAKRLNLALGSGPYSVSTLSIKDFLCQTIRTLEDDESDDSCITSTGVRPDGSDDLSVQLFRHQILDDASTACELKLRRCEANPSWFITTPHLCLSCILTSKFTQKGFRFFRCRICRNCWLCERCWYQRWSFRPDFSCFDHIADFVQIPGPNWQGFESRFVNDRQETKKQWIQRLCETFGVTPESSSQRA